MNRLLRIWISRIRFSRIKSLERKATRTLDRIDRDIVLYAYQRAEREALRNREMDYWGIYYTGPSWRPPNVRRFQPEPKGAIVNDTSDRAMGNAGG